MMLKGEKKGMALGAESHAILKGPLGASSAEEWNVQKLSNSGNPCRDGGSSDKLRCQILQCTSSAHLIPLPIFYKLISLFHFSPVGKKRAYLPLYVFEKTRVSCYKL